MSTPDNSKSGPREPAAGDLFLGCLSGDEVTTVRDLSASEHEELSMDLSTVRTFHRESQSYNHVLRDHDDLTQYANGILEIVRQHGTSPDLALDVEVELNRRVVSLLSSFKAFIDRTAHTLSSRFGKPSAELSAFRAACSAEFDSQFAYRFACKLRDYSAHMDLPIGYTHLSSAGKSGTRPVDLNLLCLRDELLGSGFGWGKLTSELHAQPATWDLRLTLDQLMPCLARIRAVAISPILPRVTRAAETIMRLASEVGADRQPVVLHVIDPSPNRTHIRMNVFPFNHAAEILATHGRK